MIAERPPEALRLFDLIGRDWALDAPVRRIAFNAAGTAVACLQEDGALALLPMADAEHPETRVRVEADTGRASIRPREKPVPPATVAPLRGARTLCRLGARGFAVAGPGGALSSVTARGQVTPMTGEDAAPVRALCALPGREAICTARGGTLALTGPGGGAPHAAQELGAPVDLLAASADGTALAALAGGKIAILGAEDLAPRASIPVAGLLAGAEPLELAWSPDRRWVLLGAARRLVLADVAAGTADAIVDFPGPVASAEVSAPTGVLLAAGAFRAVGWRAPDLPFGAHPGDPVETGKPGLTLVDRIAAHPRRDSCAVGYANGLVTLCRIGARDELMLIEGGGAGVRALAWSEDGAHLAIGFADGRAAVATFPKVMFK